LLLPHARAFWDINAGTEEAARMMRQHCIDFNEEAAARAWPCGGGANADYK